MLEYEDGQKFCGEQKKIARIQQYHADEQRHGSGLLERRENKDMSLSAFGLYLYLVKPHSAIGSHAKCVCYFPH